MARIIHTIEGLFRVGGIAASGARVDVKGRKDGQQRIISYGVADKMARFTGIPAAIGAQLVKGRKDGQQRIISYGVADKMARLTGIPAAIGAQLLAEGRIEARGVFAPEGCLAPQPFLDELSKRGIEIHRLE